MDWLWATGARRRRHDRGEDAEKVHKHPDHNEGALRDSWMRQMNDFRRTGRERRRAPRMERGHNATCTFARVMSGVNRPVRFRNLVAMEVVPLGRRALTAAQ